MIALIVRSFWLEDTEPADFATMLNDIMVEIKKGNLTKELTSSIMSRISRVLSDSDKISTIKIKQLADELTVLLQKDPTNLSLIEALTSIEDIMISRSRGDVTKRTLDPTPAIIDSTLESIKALTGKTGETTEVALRTYINRANRLMSPYKSTYRNIIARKVLSQVGSYPTEFVEELLSLDIDLSIKIDVYRTLFSKYSSDSQKTDALLDKFREEVKSISDISVSGDDVSARFDLQRKYNDLLTMYSTLAGFTNDLIEHADLNIADVTERETFLVELHNTLLDLKQKVDVNGFAVRESAGNSSFADQLKTALAASPTVDPIHIETLRLKIHALRNDLLDMEKRQLFNLRKNNMSFLWKMPIECLKEEILKKLLKS